MANNIFQQQVTPIIPKTLEEERVYVYVPRATTTDPGIASYDETNFIVNNGKVYLKPNNPFEQHTIVKLDPSSFKYENGIVSIDWDGNLPTIDTEMSDSSTNPVQNKVIKHYVDNGLNLKLNKNLGASHAGEFLKIDNSGNIIPVFETVGGKIDVIAVDGMDLPIVNKRVNITGLAKSEDLNSLTLRVTTAENNILTETSSRIQADANLQSQINAISVPVTSVNTKIGDVVLNATDIKLTTNQQTVQANFIRIDEEVEAIIDVIPEQANINNKLADKAFVNSTVQTATANFRGNWTNWASVPINDDEYPEDYLHVKTPSTNDYMVVQDASGYVDPFQVLVGTWRFKYTGVWSVSGKNGWFPEYQVNETPLTAAQLAALNSGITANKVTEHDFAYSCINGIYNQSSDTLSVTNLYQSGNEVYGVIVQSGMPTGTANVGQHYIDSQNGMEYVYTNAIDGITGNNWKQLGVAQVDLPNNATSGTISARVIKECPNTLVYYKNEYYRYREEELSNYDRIYYTFDGTKYKQLYFEAIGTSGTYDWTYSEIEVGKHEDYLSVERLGAYIYKTTFDSIPAYVGGTGNLGGGCTSFVRDGKLYRQLDWNYDNTAEFEVVTKNFKGMAFISGVTDGNIENGNLGQLPYHLVDGMNNDGIRAAVHILYNDWQYAGSGSKNIDITTIVYHILNEVHNINNLSTVMTPYLSNIKIPTGLANLGYVAQFIVTDGITTYAILPPTTASGSWDITNITALPKMTNFRWLNKATITRNDADLQLHPTGIERWNLISASTTLQDLRFTLCYESPDRLSEFIGIDNTTKDSTDAELEAIYNLAHAEYLNRERDGTTWQSVHSVVYESTDFNSLFVQENYNVDYIVKGGGGGSVTTTNKIEENNINPVTSGGLYNIFHSKRYW